MAIVLTVQYLFIIAIVLTLQHLVVIATVLTFQYLVHPCKDLLTSCLTHIADRKCWVWYLWLRIQSSVYG